MVRVRVNHEPPILIVFCTYCLVFFAGWIADLSSDFHHQTSVVLSVWCMRPLGNFSFPLQATEALLTSMQRTPLQDHMSWPADGCSCAVTNCWGSTGIASYKLTCCEINILVFLKWSVDSWNIQFHIGVAMYPKFRSIMVVIFQVREFSLVK